MKNTKKKKKLPKLAMNSNFMFRIIRIILWIETNLSSGSFIRSETTMESLSLSSNKAFTTLQNLLN